MTAARFYLVDSDVLITAKNLYYAFDICPGFWTSLIRWHRQGRVFSVDRVRSELMAASRADSLVKWVSNDVPEGFFLSVDTEEVVRAYDEVMSWVEHHPRYFDSAKSKFATGADPWLVAYACVGSGIVVTNERSAPASRREIKLPEACNQFSVPSENTYAMLRALNANFVSLEYG